MPACLNRIGLESHSHYTSMILKCYPVLLYLRYKATIISIFLELGINLTYLCLMSVSFSESGWSHITYW